MAISVSMVKDTFRYTGFQCEGEFDITFDSSYVTGGESYTARNFGMGSVQAIYPDGMEDGYGMKPDYTNLKLKMFYADYDAVADGALIEVANGVNLSAVIVRCRILGSP
jgi:hypothetical protein